MASYEDFGIQVDGNVRSGEFRTTCPQCSHERHKSWDKCLSVNLDKHTWYCHHCFWSGGLGDSRPAAIHSAAPKEYNKPHFVECEIEDQNVITWFKGRGISVPTLKMFHIKSGQAWMHGKQDGMTNCVQFPFFWHGEVVNVKYRAGDKRFRQEKNPRKVFYNYDMAMASGDMYLAITEGEMDCMALYEAGFTAVVSVPDGAPAPDAKTYATKFDFMDGAEELIDKFKGVILAVDNDRPGQKLLEELSRRIGCDRCLTVVWPEGCKDANDVLMKYGRDVLHDCIKLAQEMPVEGVKGVADLYEALSELYMKPEQAGMDLGWQNAKECWNLEPGQMTVVTGIPSHGKSTWVDAMRVNLFRQYGCRSAVFSPENWPAEGHLANLMGQYMGKDFHSLTPDEIPVVAGEMDGGFWFIQPEDDSAMMTVETILEKAKTLVFRNGVQLLVIDPWNEIEHDIPAGQREDQYISTQLARIRRFARVQRVHVIIIAHPRQLEKDKNGDYPPPTAYDIAGGAMWRNKADNILCVYRPDITTSETQVFVQKVRFKRNGKAGTAMSFKFHVGSATYRDNGVVV